MLYDICYIYTLIGPPGGIYKKILLKDYHGLLVYYYYHYAFFFIYAFFLLNLFANKTLCTLGASLMQRYYNLQLLWIGLCN